MKKKIIFFPFILLLILFLESCSLNENNDYNIYSGNIDYSYSSDSEFEVPESDNPLGYKVQYVCNNGEIGESTSNLSNKVIDPGAPKKLFAKFLGWYSDLELNNIFDFNTVIDSDITLYGKWDINYPNLISYIYQNTILANVKIDCQAFKYNSNGKKSYSSSVSQGSGVIFHENNNYYFILTNNHVVYIENDYDGADYTIFDCYNNEYSGQLFVKDKDYDLAILALPKDNLKKDLCKLDFLSYDIDIGQEVISISNPKGLSNSISFGTVKEYYRYVPSQATIDKNNINFDVIKSDTYINSGSSGGVLLDTNLKIAGISFASQSTITGEYLHSYAIPSSKVIEFVNTYI